MCWVWEHGNTRPGQNMSQYFRITCHQTDTCDSGETRLSLPMIQKILAILALEEHKVTVYKIKIIHKNEDDFMHYISFTFHHRIDHQMNICFLIQHFSDMKEKGICTLTQNQIRFFCS